VLSDGRECAGVALFLLPPLGVWHPATYQQPQASREASDEGVLLRHRRGGYPFNLDGKSKRRVPGLGVCSGTAAREEG
jgi:hypothetical protein